MRIPAALAISFALLPFVSVGQVTGTFARPTPYSDDPSIQKPDYSHLTPLQLRRLEERLASTEKDIDQLHRDATKENTEKLRLQQELAITIKERNQLKEVLDRLRSHIGERDRTAVVLLTQLHAMNASPGLIGLVERILETPIQDTVLSPPAAPTEREISSHLVIKGSLGGVVTPVVKTYDVYANFLPSGANQLDLYETRQLIIALRPTGKYNLNNLIIAKSAPPLLRATTIAVTGDVQPLLHPDEDFSSTTDTVVSNQLYTWKITPAPGRFKGSGPWPNELRLSIAGSLGEPLIFRLRVQHGGWWIEHWQRLILFLRGGTWSNLVAFVSFLFSLVVGGNQLHGILRPKQKDHSPLDDLEFSDEADVGTQTNAEEQVPAP